MLWRRKGRLSIKQLYSITKESKEAYRRLDRLLLTSDLILILLSISPIRGNTMLQKEVFLTWKNFFNDISVDPIFFAYKYGAYSKVVEDSVKMLEKQKYIKIRKGRGEGLILSIRDEGKDMIMKKIRRNKIDLTEIAKKKIDWDELTSRAIIKLVYRRYPEYSTESVVPSLKW